MAKTLSDHLLNSLEQLLLYDFEKFKFMLQNTNLEKEYSLIPRGVLQMAGPVKLATLMVNYYGEEDAIRLTLQVLRAINQRFLAEKLQKTTGQGKAEAGKGPQKKSQDRCLDKQGKPGARSMTPPSRRGPALSSARLPGEKGCIRSPSLRRNANSTSRLQELCSHSFSGSLRRPVYEKAEAKKRPKSLEFAIPSGERGPVNPETLRSLTNIRIVTPGIVAVLGAEEAPGVPEKGSRGLEDSMRQEQDTLRSALTSVSLTGGEHEASTAPLEENGIGSSEAPGMFCEPSNPQSAPSLGKKGLQNPGHASSLDTVVCKGKPQEGDPVGGSCVHGSSSCSGEHGASGNHSLSCPRGQAPLPKQQQLLRSVSSEPPPQCERHKQQPCLLFCEEHSQPVCLICNLSQEHRGHQVRPIEEAALEYQEQIHWQLEHLKELRKSGQEQKCQGDKETANFLKQMEDQKQKVRCQMQQLCHFLEKQEQLFVARLEELGQTIGQAGENYDSRVSRDIALLDELIGELEAKQCQPAWGLMQDIGITLQRAKTATVPEPWATPSEVKEKLHLFYHKSEFVEKSMKRFSENLRSEMETFLVEHSDQLQD
ncbi:pyrin [Echinops telfairi]|uniref:Pyrin n=1 Tax=Echinops telfairi TaxID=9371 RepID=A0AC55CP70_ECHTE|nr:pyrin [Echinops telfairi]